MTVVASPAEEYHSRFDESHYSHCQPCYDDHLDFMYDQEADARLDAMSEREQYEDNEEE